MTKLLFASAIAAFAFTGSAFAAGDTPCTEAERAKIMDMIHATKDEHAMKMAMEDVNMAVEMFQKGDVKGCRMDLMKAMEMAAPAK